MHAPATTPHHARQPSDLQVIIPWTWEVEISGRSFIEQDVRVIVDVYSPEGPDWGIYSIEFERYDVRTKRSQWIEIGKKEAVYPLINKALDADRDFGDCVREEIHAAVAEAR